MIFSFVFKHKYQSNFKTESAVTVNSDLYITNNKFLSIFTTFVCSSSRKNMFKNRKQNNQGKIYYSTYMVFVTFYIH